MKNSFDVEFEKHRAEYEELTLDHFFAFYEPMFSKGQRIYENEIIDFFKSHNIELKYNEKYSKIIYSNHFIKNGKCVDFDYKEFKSFTEFGSKIAEVAKIEKEYEQFYNDFIKNIVMYSDSEAHAYEYILDKYDLRDK